MRARSATGILPGYADNPPERRPALPPGESGPGDRPGPGVPPAPRHRLDGPTRRELTHRQRVEWHHHAEHQLIHPSRGVLRVSTAVGTWIVPPQRAIWVPAGVAHAHEAHGPTQMRTLCFPRSLSPLRADRPTVLAVGPLLREVIVGLTGDGQEARSARRRRTLQQVALDELREVEALPLWLPAPADDRLRAVAALLRADPADPRPLAALGAAVGAGERTLSRLFRAETGMSFPQWRTQVRLHHSLVLLADRGAR